MQVMLPQGHPHLKEALLRKRPERALFQYKQSSEIPQTERRGIMLMQLSALFTWVDLVFNSYILVEQNRYSPTCGERINMDFANMYQICDHAVMPATFRFKCSWVELVADQPQDPRWFVSHAWSTVFRHTLNMLEFHAEVHGLPPHTPYWICTFANNQHNLEELQVAVEETPFWKAIGSDSCEGVVQLMDPDVTPLGRAWCVMELHAGCHLNKPLEILAIIPKGSQTVTDTDGVEHSCPFDSPSLQDANSTQHSKWPQGRFPPEVALKGQQVMVQNCRASREQDRLNILRCIAGVKNPCIIPPQEHAGYDAVNSVVRGLFRGPVMCALSAQGDEAGLSQMLTIGNEGVNTMTRSGVTPLSEAASRGHDAVVRLLVEAGAELNLHNYDGQAPVGQAACAGYDATVSTLTELGADVNAINSDGLTQLCLAVAHCRDSSEETSWRLAKAVVILARARADVNIPDNTGSSPLFKAAQAGNSPLVTALLTFEANPDCTNHEGLSPLHAAFSYISNRPKAADQEADREALDSCICLVESLVSANATLDLADRTGATPLLTCAELGDAELLRRLLRLGANHRQTNNMGLGPLQIAVEHGHLPVVQALCEVLDYSELDAPNQSSATPLATVMHSLKQRQFDPSLLAIAELLVAHNARLDQVSEGAIAPIAAIAEWSNHMDRSMDAASCVVRLLAQSQSLAYEPMLEAGLEAGFGLSLVYAALEQNQEVVVQSLLDCTVDINARVSSSPPLLHIAVERQDLEVVEKLLALNADSNQQDSMGRTALLMACYDSNPLIQRLERSVDASFEADERALPQGRKFEADLVDAIPGCGLAGSVGRNDRNAHVMKLLLSHDACVNMSDSSGETPLVLAVRAGEPGMVQLLLEHRADIDKPSGDGISPVTKAVHNYVRASMDRVVNTVEAQTPARSSQEAVVQLLLHSKADVHWDGMVAEAAWLAGLRVAAIHSNSRFWNFDETMHMVPDVREELEALEQRLKSFA